MEERLEPDAYAYFQHIVRGNQLGKVSMQLLRDFTHTIVSGTLDTREQLKATFKELHAQHVVTYPPIAAKSTETDPDVEYNERPCRSCGAKRCFNILRQTRAGDEGTTLMVYCEACKRESYA